MQPRSNFSIFQVIGRIILGEKILMRSSSTRIPSTAESMFVHVSSKRDRSIRHGVRSACLRVQGCCLQLAFLTDGPKSRRSAVQEAIEICCLEGIDRLPDGRAHAPRRVRALPRNCSKLCKLIGSSGAING